MYFATPEDWRAWLERHHDTETELVVGFYKVDSGTPSITWPQSVDEALCFGWIDGVRRRVDDQRYTIRFTPRRARSIWSLVNVRRVKELRAQGRMTAAGERAFAARDEARTGVYSAEREQDAVLSPQQEARLRAHVKAAAFFAAQAPSYRKAALHWITSAKQPETQERRLTLLIQCSAKGTTVPPLTRPSARARKP